MAALERPRRRGDVVRGRVRRHRGEGDRGPPSRGAHRRVPPRLQPADPRPPARSGRAGGAPGAPARPIRPRTTSCRRRPSSRGRAVRPDRPGRPVDGRARGRALATGPPSRGQPLGGLDRATRSSRPASSGGSAAPVSTPGTSCSRSPRRPPSSSWTLAVDFADRLTRLGCQFALDDFGTGFGSLTHLRLLPVRFLKIDTSFVRNVSLQPRGPGDRSGHRRHRPGARRPHGRGGHRGRRHARAGQRLRRRLRAGLPHRPPGTGGLTNPARAAVQLRRRKVAAS